MEEVKIFQKGVGQMKKYRQFSEEFKRSLVAQIDSGVISKAAAARDNDISPSLITRWQNQIHEGSMQSRPTVRERQLEKELDCYKKKVGELTIQNELLKKLKQTYPSTRKSCGCIATGGSMDPSGRRAK